LVTGLSASATSAAADDEVLAMVRLVETLEGLPELLPDAADSG
jgi:hypothetical protein